MGRDQVLDASEVNVYGFWLEVNLPTKPLGPEIDIDDDGDDDDAVAAEFDFETWLILSLFFFELLYLLAIFESFLLNLLFEWVVLPPMIEDKKSFFILGHFIVPVATCALSFQVSRVVVASHIFLWLDTWNMFI